jgi:hypothetical protein
MQINDLSHPKSSKSLNESVARQFGYKLNIEKFTYEQLCSARDSLLNQLAEFEASKSYDAVYESSDYQKNRLLLDVITQAITEQSLSKEQEAKKEKYVKGMKKVKGDFKKKYGDKGEEVMYATATKMAKKESVEEAMTVLRSVLSERVLTEGEEEKAALIMSSRDMVDKLTGWLEDVASLKAEALLELLDSIRDELGSDISQQFANKVRPALEEVYTSLETNRQVLAQAVAILTGEEAPGMGAEGAPTEAPVPGQDADLEADIAAGPEMGTDEFGAAEPATGSEEPAGRAKRESIEYSRRLGTILTSKKK